MVTPQKFDEILTAAFKEMHRHTCAEASLQGLLALWEIDKEELAWATAGYAGAIQSGDSTCGLLIGTGCAMGFRVGQGLKLNSDSGNKARKKSIRNVKKFYKAFMKQFGSAQCQQLCKCDFSKPTDVARYVATKAWKSSCDVYLKFVMDYCNELTTNVKIQ